VQDSINTSNIKQEEKQMSENKELNMDELGDVAGGFVGGCKFIMSGNQQVAQCCRDRDVQYYVGKCRNQDRFLTCGPVSCSCYGKVECVNGFHWTNAGGQAMHNAYVALPRENFLQSSRRRGEMRS